MAKQEIAVIMVEKEFEEKKILVTSIIQAMSAGGCYISGDLFFRLIAVDNTGLKKIAGELCIKIQ